MQVKQVASTTGKAQISNSSQYNLFSNTSTMAKHITRTQTFTS